jgi:hypothetical protein
MKGRVEELVKNARAYLQGFEDLATRTERLATELDNYGRGLAEANSVPTAEPSSAAPAAPTLIATRTLPAVDGTRRHTHPMRPGSPVGQEPRAYSTPAIAKPQISPSRNVRDCAAGHPARERQSATDSATFNSAIRQFPCAALGRFTQTGSGREGPRQREPVGRVFARRLGTSKRRPSMTMCRRSCAGRGCQSCWRQGVAPCCSDLAAPCRGLLRSIEHCPGSVIAHSKRPRLSPRALALGRFWRR